MRAMRFGKQLMQRQVAMRPMKIAPMHFYQARLFSYAAVTEMESQFTSETQKTYATFQTSDFSFKSLLEAMFQLQSIEMSYQEYRDNYPVADELIHYFESMIEGEVQVTASQVAKLVNFGAQFGIGSHSFWEFCLE